MREPTQATSGITYERTAIVQWLETSRFDPVTHAPLRRRHLSPNLTLRVLMEPWLRDKTQDLRRQKRTRTPAEGAAGDGASGDGAAGDGAAGDGTAGDDAACNSVAAGADALQLEAAVGGRAEARHEQERDFGGETGAGATVMQGEDVQQQQHGDGGGAGQQQGQAEVRPCLQPQQRLQRADHAGDRRGNGNEQWREEHRALSEPQQPPSPQPLAGQAEWPQQTVEHPRESDSDHGSAQDPQTSQAASDEARPPPGNGRIHRSSGGSSSACGSAAGGGGGDVDGEGDHARQGRGRAATGGGCGAAACSCAV
jgi:hypothetical protein